MCRLACRRVFFSAIRTPGGTMNTPSQAQVRRAIAEAQTIVVKVGSSSLTKPSGHLDPERLNALVAALARVRLMGGRVVLVSSGAIAAGFGSLASTHAQPTWLTSRRARPSDKACSWPSTRTLSHNTDCASGKSSSPCPTPSHHSNTATCDAPSTGCSTSARCRSSTKTIPSRPTKSVSETTTDSPH